MWHTEYLTLLKINAYWVNGIRTELGVSLLSKQRFKYSKEYPVWAFQKEGMSLDSSFPRYTPGMRRYTTIIHSFIFISCKVYAFGLPCRLSGKESACRGRGHRFDLWPGRIPHSVEQLNPKTSMTEPTCHKYWDSPTREPVLGNKTSHYNEKPTYPASREQPPLATTREKPTQQRRLRATKINLKKRKVSIQLVIHDIWEFRPACISIHSHPPHTEDGSFPPLESQLWSHHLLSAMRQSQHSPWVSPTLLVFTFPSFVHCSS